MKVKRRAEVEGERVKDEVKACSYPRGVEGKVGFYLSCFAPSVSKELPKLGSVVNGVVEVDGVRRKKKLGRCPEEQRPNPESRKSHRSDPGDGNLHMYTLGLPVYIPKRG